MICGAGHDLEARPRKAGASIPASFAATPALAGPLPLPGTCTLAQHGQPPGAGAQRQAPPRSRRRRNSSPTTASAGCGHSRHAASRRQAPCGPRARTPGRRSPGCCRRRHPPAAPPRSRRSRCPAHRPACGRGQRNSAPVGFISWLAAQPEYQSEPIRRQGARTRRFRACRPARPHAPAGRRDALAGTPPCGLSRARARLAR